MNLGNIDTDFADERAVLGDADDPAVHRRLDTAFHHQRVAIQNLSTLELDVRPDDQACAEVRLGILGDGRPVLVLNLVQHWRGGLYRRRSSCARVGGGGNDRFFDIRRTRGDRFAVSSGRACAARGGIR